MSAGKLDIILPKLKKIHERSNRDIDDRQSKVISIMRSDVVNDINSPDARKFYKGKSPQFTSAKSYGKKFNRDLIQNLSQEDSNELLKNEKNFGYGRNSGRQSEFPSLHTNETEVNLFSNRRLSVDPSDQ